MHLLVLTTLCLLLLHSTYALEISTPGEPTQKKKRRKKKRRKKQPKTSITFDPPVVTEEERDSGGLPAVHSCDACAAVMHQLATAFAAAEAAALPSTSPLTESAAIDAVESGCMRGAYNEYGLKGISSNDRKELSLPSKVLNGPGITRSADLAGVVAGGGSWPKRLSDLCWSVVGNLEEGELTLLRMRDTQKGGTIGTFTPSPKCAPCAAQQQRAVKRRASQNPSRSVKASSVEVTEPPPTQVTTPVTTSPPAAALRRELTRSAAVDGVAAAMRGVAQLTLALSELQVALLDDDVLPDTITTTTTTATTSSSTSIDTLLERTRERWRAAGATLEAQVFHRSNNAPRASSREL